MSAIRKLLSGKKTILGGILMSILSATWGLDVLVHDNPATEIPEVGWVSVGQYAAIGGVIAGLTAVANRFAIRKLGK